ncbi:MAG: hypothetical protein QM627_13860 [Luteolibacter sp.]
MLKVRPALFERAQRAGFLLIGGGNGRLDEFRMAAKLPDDPQHEFIQSPARQVADGAGRRPAVLADFIAGVVEVGIAVLVLLPARLGSEAMAADAAMDDALEERAMDVALQPVLGIAARSCLAADGVIGLLPELGTDKLGMLAGIVFAPMPDDPLVKGIGDDGGDFVADVAFASHNGLTTPAALHLTSRSPQPLCVEECSNLRGTAQVTAQFKDTLRHLRIPFMNPDLFRGGVVGVTERCPSAVPHAALGAFSQLVAHPLHGGFTLELREGKQHVHHEHTHGCAGVERLRGGNEMHAVLLKHFPEVVEVRQGSGDAVELVGDDHLDFPGPDGVKQGLDAGAFEVLAGETGVIEEVGGGPAFMPVKGNGVLADVALGIERTVVAPCLVIGGNTGVDRAADERSGTGAVGGGGNGMERFHRTNEGKASG